MKPKLRAALLLLFLAFPLMGCDDDEFEHDPPDGQSGLIVVNDLGVDLRVFIDGEEVRDVDSFDDRTYNLEPGLHRIILDPRDSTATYQDEIELLVNRTLILLVRGFNFDGDLNVDMRLD